MGKFLCAYGQIIFNQSDLIVNKAHVIADHDYMNFFAEVESKEFMEMTDKAVKYFNEIFQCEKCNRLIIFRQSLKKDISFIPEDGIESDKILRSNLDDK